MHRIAETKEYRRASAALLHVATILALAFSLLAAAWPARTEAAAPPAPTYDAAIVDGLIDEWTLIDDFFAVMHRGGKLEFPWAANLHLRYDCVAQTMYALVLTVNDDNGNPIPARVDAPGIAGLALNSTGNSVVTGNSGNDGTPPDFAWVDVGFDGNPDHARGFEASFSMSPGTYQIFATLGVVLDGMDRVANTLDYPTSGPALVVSCYDLGDLPDSYQTLLSNNGARHEIGSLFMGQQIDGETDGQPSANANGDDTANVPDDEDGIQMVGNWNSGTGRVDVTVTGGNACLNAWMDFTDDGQSPTWSGVLGASDGNFLNPNGASGFDQHISGGVTYSEWIIQNATVTAGLQSVFFSLPPDVMTSAAQGRYYLRYRLTPRDADGGCANAEAYGGSASPAGTVLNGEVEDYFFEQLTPPAAVLLNSFGAETRPGHVLVSWETASELGNLGFNLYRSTSAGAASQQINLDLIASQAPGSAQGAFYTWQDADVTAGTTYFYFLEDVALNGATTLHGPASVTYQAPTAVTLSGLAAKPASVPAGVPAAAAPVAAGLLALLMVAWRQRSRPS